MRASYTVEIVGCAIGAILCVAYGQVGLAIAFMVIALALDFLRTFQKVEQHMQQAAPAMTFDRFREIVGKVTYKPGTRFATRFALERSPPQIELMIVCDTIDAKNPSKRLTVHSSDYIFEERLMRSTEADVLRTIYALARRLETHEIDEWLRYDGQHVNPPEH
jgi:hypothetical protein